jgi:hypothetical protein
MNRHFEFVAVDQLLEERRLATASHPLDDQRDVGTKLTGHRDRANHRPRRRRVPMTPVRGNSKEVGFFHLVEFTRQHWNVQ